MSNEDFKIQRRFVETNPTVPPIMREYFKALNAAVTDGWPTTSTSTTTSTTSTTSTSSSTTTTTSSTTTSSSSTTTTTAP